jgi:hypothetical protein
MAKNGGLAPFLVELRFAMLFSFDMPVETIRPTRELMRAASCPVCGDAVRETRGVVKCQRCQFVYCQGCDGDNSAAGWSPAED